MYFGRLRPLFRVFEWKLLSVVDLLTGDRLSKTRWQKWDILLAEHSFDDLGWNGTAVISDSWILSPDILGPDCRTKVTFWQVHKSPVCLSLSQQQTWHISPIFISEMFLPWCRSWKLGCNTSIWNSCTSFGNQQIHVLKRTNWRRRIAVTGPKIKRVWCSAFEKILFFWKICYKLQHKRAKLVVPCKLFIICARKEFRMFYILLTMLTFDWGRI